MSDPAPRRLAILGSTGSIGTQALEVVAANPGDLEVVALVAGNDEETLRDQAARFKVSRTGLGSQAAEEFAAAPDVDVVLNAIVGAAGLRASVAALRSGKVLALANKESLVAGGEVCTTAAAEGGGAIVPVDSEHAALFQCLASTDREVQSLVVTASGGPFREQQDLEGVTVEEALAHPTWSMGRKITIDSATLMNKGLEVIEAHYLFGFDYDDIEVVVHPESVVHGAVKYADGTMILQAAPTDMRIPIQSALMWPQTSGAIAGSIELAEIGHLSFEPVDTARFPCLGLAYRAGRVGDTYPAALNASNEVAVGAFLSGRIPFTAIPTVVQRALDDHIPRDPSTLDEVLAADADARAIAERTIEESVGVSS